MKGQKKETVYTVTQETVVLEGSSLLVFIPTGHRLPKQS